MTKIKIVTDSSCTMDDKLREQYGIEVVPLSIMVDGTLYTDDGSISGPKFMDMMANSHALPKTSQPPIGLFAEKYEELGEDGSQVISIHMTKLLSGTVEAARQAAQMSSTDVTVIDSEYTDQGMAFQVVCAAKMAQAGSPLDEILEAIRTIRTETSLYVGVANMDNLVKGGRVSRVAGMISSVFNMRVVMKLLPDELLVEMKGRGTKAFHKWFDGLIEELKQYEQVKQIAISHADGLEIATYFKENLQKLFPQMDIPLLHTNSVISTHAGKGAFAVMYYAK